jgi:hypothetical protein
MAGQELRDRGTRAGYDRAGREAAGRKPFPNGVILDGEYMANWRRTLFARILDLPPSLTIQDGPDA